MDGCLGVILVEFRRDNLPELVEIVLPLVLQQSATGSEDCWGKEARGDGRRVVGVGGSV
jgi:hypothetical protein